MLVGLVAGPVGLVAGLLGLVAGQVGQHLQLQVLVGLVAGLVRLLKSEAPRKFILRRYKTNCRIRVMTS